MKSDMASKPWDHSMLKRLGFFHAVSTRQGLSADAGPYISDLIDKAKKTGGQSNAVKVMIELLTQDHLDDQMAALAWLKTQNSSRRTALQ